MRPSARRVKITALSYIAFAWSTQSAETLQNALQYTDRKRQFVVYEHDRSTVFFFTICGWKQEDIFLWVISILHVYGWTGIICANKWRVSVILFALRSLQQKSVPRLFTPAAQHKMKIPRRNFRWIFAVCLTRCFHIKSLLPGEMQPTQDMTIFLSFVWSKKLWYNK